MTRPRHDATGHPRSAVSKREPLSTELIPHVAPEVPSHLGAHGRQVWHHLWNAGQGVYNPVTDIFVIERYASFQERRGRLMNELDLEGMMILGSQGQMVLNPKERILKDLEQKLVALEDRLGLSPESRLRLGISAVEHKSKLEQFIDRGRPKP